MPAAGAGSASVAGQKLPAFWRNCFHSCKASRRQRQRRRRACSTFSTVAGGGRHGATRARSDGTRCCSTPCATRSSGICIGSGEPCGQGRGPPLYGPLLETRSGLVLALSNKQHGSLVLVLVGAGGGLSVRESATRRIGGTLTGLLPFLQGHLDNTVRVVAGLGGAWAAGYSQITFLVRCGARARLMARRAIDNPLTWP